MTPERFEEMKIIRDGMRKWFDEEFERWAEPGHSPVAPLGPFQLSIEQATNLVEYVEEFVTEFEKLKGIAPVSAAFNPGVLHIPVSRIVGRKLPEPGDPVYICQLPGDPDKKREE